MDPGSLSIWEFLDIGEKLEMEELDILEWIDAYRYLRDQQDEKDPKDKPKIYNKF